MQLFSLVVRGQKSSTPSGIVVGKILRSTITAHKGLVEKFKNYCERVIFLHILPDAYIYVRSKNNIYSHPQMKKLRQKHIGINSVLGSQI